MDAGLTELDTLASQEYRDINRVINVSVWAMLYSLEIKLKLKIYAQK